MRLWLALGGIFLTGSVIGKLLAEDNIDRRLASCLTKQAEAQANSFFSPSFKSDVVAAVGTLLGRCGDTVKEWEASCARSGDTTANCEMKSSLLAAKALQNAGAQ